MSKYIIFLLSTITLLILITVGIKGFRETKLYSTTNYTDHLNGTYVENSKIDFDKSIPIIDYAINFWSSIKNPLFKEGNKGVLVGNENWLFTTEEYDESLIANLTRSEFFDYVQEVDSYFKERDISLIVSPLPSKSRVYSDKISRYPLPEIINNRFDSTIAELKESQIQYIDLGIHFSNQKEFHQLFYKYDTHWTLDGTSAAARLISEKVAPLKTLYDLEERSYVVNKESKSFFEGDLLNYVPSFKKKVLNFKMQETYKTLEIEDLNPPKLGLFDSPEIPVLLVGTSYSDDSRWNFENILKQNLQLDVLNLSKEGKGPLPPMEELIESEYYREVNSKIIIWEIPERYIPVN